MLKHKLLGIVPAGGIGSRMQSHVPKQFLEINGKPILIITLESLLATGLFSNIVISTVDIETTQDLVAKHLAKHKDLIHISLGGSSRQESVHKALQYAQTNQLIQEFTLVHDAVRALIDSDTVNKTYEQAIESGAAMAARPISDTIKLAKENNLIDKTIPRDNLWAAQTPQIFKTSIMLEAFTKATEEGFTGTDCASLLERLGYDVALVESPATNIKITTPEDLELATVILSLTTAGRQA